jgi:hypothetical protein
MATERVQELMNSVQVRMTAFKEHERARFSELQREAVAHERHLELFLERAGAAAWHEDAAVVNGGAGGAAPGAAAAEPAPLATQGSPAQVCNMVQSWIVLAQMNL